MLNTTFIISGGAGRVVTAIPALEKYYRLNPYDNFKVLVHGWEAVFWSNPILQSRTFSANQKGTFELHIKNNIINVPEPYFNNNYYNQHINLVEAFDEEINRTSDHSDLEYSGLFLSNPEKEYYKEVVTSLKIDRKKRRLVVFQPFGSGVNIINKKPIDSTNRSLTLDHYLKITKLVEKNAIVVYASDPAFKPLQDKESVTLEQFPSYLRALMGFVYHCDLFIGCDSVGQHVARFFNKQGVVFMGSTHEVSASYPNHFEIIRKQGQDPVFLPLRLSEIDCDFSNRSNDGIMNYSDDEVQTAIAKINQKLGLSTVEITENNTKLVY